MDDTGPVVREETKGRITMYTLKYHLRYGVPGVGSKDMQSSSLEKLVRIAERAMKEGTDPWRWAWIEDNFDNRSVACWDKGKRLPTVGSIKGGS